MRHRLEDDQELGRQLQRQLRLFAGRQLERVERDLLDHPFEILRQLHRRGPEDLAEIFGEGQLVRVVRRDAADAAADRERHLDHLVERRLVAGGAEAQTYSSWPTVFSVAPSPSTPPQPGQTTFHANSKMPSRAACRNAAIVSSSSIPLLAAKSTTLIAAQRAVRRRRAPASRSPAPRPVGRLPQHGKQI